VFKRPLLPWLVIVAAMLVFILAAVSGWSWIWLFAGYETAVGLGAMAVGAVVFRFFAKDFVAVNADIARRLRSKLSLRSRQLIMGLAFIPYFIVALSALAGKQWFGYYQKPVTSAGLFLMFVLFVFLSPTAAEEAETRRKNFREYLHWRRQHEPKKDRTE
jgi:hypothetical protein